MFDKNLLGHLLFRVPWFSLIIALLCINMISSEYLLALAVVSTLILSKVLRYGMRPKDYPPGNTDIYFYNGVAR